MRLVGGHLAAMPRDLCLDHAELAVGVRDERVDSLLLVEDLAAMSLQLFAVFHDFTCDFFSIA